MNVQDLSEFDKECFMEIYDQEEIADCDHEILPSVEEEIKNLQSEDDTVRMIRSGNMSDQMMVIADEIQQELDEEFLDECDETFREAA